MRLARVAADQADAAAVLTAFAGAGQLDLLQLDYFAADPRDHSATFFEQFRVLHKHLFLDPSLRVITNAGGGAVIPCMEALGEYLRAHGDPRMPVCAVRGDNLLPRLAELAADGIELVDESTAEPLKKLKQPLLAAQVELGAGPFATAWAEGARIVVAGCYDAAAPFIGAAAAEAALNWNDYNALAPVAIAAYATSIAELDDCGVVSLESYDSKPANAKVLQSLPLVGGLLRHADVNCDTSNLALRPTEFGKVGLEGVTGSEPAESWRVRLTYAAENMLDSPPTFVRWSRIPRDAVRVSVDTRPASEWV